MPLLKKMTALTIATLLVGSLAACTKTTTPNTTTTQSVRNANIYDNYGPKAIPNDAVKKYPNGTYPFNEKTARPSGSTNMDNNVANRLARIAADIDGVTKATAVVNGKEAVVGIDVDPRKNRTTVENNVLLAVRKGDPAYTIHITSNANLNQRIRTLNDQMKAGHPIRTIGQDFSTIIRDIGKTISAPFR